MAGLKYCLCTYEVADTASRMAYESEEAEEEGGGHSSTIGDLAESI